MLVKELVGNLNIASLQLGERDLLLDELEEKLLFLSDAAAHLRDLVLALLESLRLEVAEELVAGTGRVTTAIHLIAVLGVLILVVGPVEAEIFGHMLVIMVVDDVVSILADDTHGRQHIERVINTTLNVLKIDLLAFLICAKFQIKHLKGVAGRSLAPMWSTYIAELFIHL